MRILLTGGGSGGHVSPALAVAAWFKAHGHSVLYVGSHTGPEKALAEAAGLKYLSISTGKLRRYFSLQNFLDPFRVLRGYFQSRKIIRSYQPDAVFSSGGFVALPVGRAALSLKVPLTLLEADLAPGLTNRLLASRAAQICLAYPAARKHFPHSLPTLVTGLPLQDRVLKGDSNRFYALTGLDRKHPLLLVLGGSQGAENLNRLLWEALPSLVKFCNIVHLTGTGKSHGHTAIPHYLPLESVPASAMADLYAAATCAFTRGGSNTLFELAAWRIPSLVLPLSSAAADHQTANAHFFSRTGGMLTLSEQSATASQVLDSLKIIFKNRAAMHASLALDANGTEQICQAILATLKS